MSECMRRILKIHMTKILCYGISLLEALHGKNSTMICKDIIIGK